MGSVQLAQEKQTVPAHQKRQARYVVSGTHDSQAQPDAAPARAAASSSNKRVWSNAQLVARFEALVMLTNRPVVLRKLLNIDVSEKELRGHIAAVQRKYQLNRPGARAKPMSAVNASFLRSNLDRTDASYLLALAARAEIAKAAAAGSEQYVDRLIAVYELYRRNVVFARANHQGAPVSDVHMLPFEAFVELLQAVNAGLVAARSCDDCGARYAYKPKLLIGHAEYQCPFCLEVPQQAERRSRKRNTRAAEARAATTSSTRQVNRAVAQKVA